MRSVGAGLLRLRELAATVLEGVEKAGAAEDEEAAAVPGSGFVAALEVALAGADEVLCRPAVALLAWYCC